MNQRSDQKNQWAINWSFNSAKEQQFWKRRGRGLGRVLPNPLGKTSGRGGGDKRAFLPSKGARLVTQVERFFFSEPERGKQIIVFKNIVLKNKTLSWSEQRAHPATLSSRKLKNIKLKNSPCLIAFFRDQLYWTLDIAIACILNK